MSAQKWFKAGGIDPSNLLGGDFDLRDVLNRAKGLDDDAWLVAESGSGTYLLTHAELLKLRKRLLKQLGRGPSNPLIISIDELLRQSDLTPEVRLDMPGKPVIDIEKLLREVKYRSANRVLVFEPADGSIAVWQRTSPTAIPFPDEIATTIPADAAAPDDGKPGVEALPDAPDASASLEAESALSVSPGLLGDEGSPRFQCNK